MTASARGAALVDLLLACALAALLAAVSIAAGSAARDRDEARLAARYLASRLHAARVLALRQNAAVALRFNPDALDRVSVYVDGDGDGVQQRDIDRGIDRLVEPETSLQDVFAGVTFRVRAAVPSPEGAGTIAADSDPLRIGNTNFVSFGPAGTATSGSLYLAGTRGPQVCLRIFGATGRLRVLWFDEARRTWRQD